MKQGIIKLTLGGLIMAYLLIAGCKNDSVLGPNMNSQVSFQISQQQGVNGGIQFLFKSNQNVSLSRVISKYNAQQFADTLNYTNTAYVYSKDTTYIINEYVGTKTGQQWNFDFTGSIPGQQNSNYNVTSNYTVQ